MSRFRRPRHHTYDYNFKAGESGYRDMIDYLDRKESRRYASPSPVKHSGDDGERVGSASWEKRLHFPDNDNFPLSRPRSRAQELASREHYDSSYVGSCEKKTRFVNENHGDMISHASSKNTDRGAELDTDKLIDYVRSRRMRLQKEHGDQPRGGRISTSDKSEDFGQRMRMTIQEIDNDFKELGLYDRTCQRSENVTTRSYASKSFNEASSIDD